MRRCRLPLPVPTIRVIDEGEAEGRLKEIYDDVRRRRGAVADILKVHSLLPETLATHLDLYVAIQFGRSELSRPDREMLAVVVSAANGCRYCVAHHSDALARYWKDEPRVARLAADWKSAGLSPAEAALCAYAEELTRAPAGAKEEAVARLRAAGFGDEGILQATLTVAYFNFVNRIANATGIDPAADVAKDYRY